MYFISDTLASKDCKNYTNYKIPVQKKKHLLINNIVFRAQKMYKKINKVTLMF